MACIVTFFVFTYYTVLWIEQISSPFFKRENEGIKTSESCSKLFRDFVV